MSEANDETSLVEGEKIETTTAPSPDEQPSSPGLVEEIEEQERGGWLNEPTTG